MIAGHPSQTRIWDLAFGPLCARARVVINVTTTITAHQQQGPKQWPSMAGSIPEFEGAKKQGKNPWFQWFP